MQIMNSARTVDDSWQCGRCTFMNHGALLECEVCQSRRISNEFSSLSCQTTNNSTAIRSNNRLSVSCTMGLLSELKLAFRRTHTAVRLCSPSCVHYTQRNTYGASWSCGYRNIQMLCSSLMCIADYRAVMFNRDGVVPEIESLQKWIERAWRDGFDSDVSMPSLVLQC